MLLEVLADGGGIGGILDGPLREFRSRLTGGLGVLPDGVNSGLIHEMFGRTIINVELPSRLQCLTSLLGNYLGVLADTNSVK